MAEKFDIASRLGEGRPTVDVVSQYVSACELLGYQQPDLTARPAQHWYGSEDGLDLRALGSDCAALEAAVSGAERALALQGDQRAALSGAWEGRNAEAATAFLRRHGDASARVVAALRAAADTLAALRDDLWQAVDAKVGATQSICADGAERADWRTAAHAVITGAGDRATASELVDQQVKPFVDTAIRSRWLDAMREARSAVADSYDAATRALTAGPAVDFEVPGELGPPPALPSGGDRPMDGDGSPMVDRTVPAAAAPPSVASAPAAPPMWSAPAAAPAPADYPAASPTPLDAGMPAAAPFQPSAPSLGELGGGLPGGGAGGLGGFGQQLADLLGGLLPSAGDGVGDPLTEPAAIDTLDGDEPEDATLDEDVAPEDNAPDDDDSADDDETDDEAEGDPEDDDPGDDDPGGDDPEDEAADDEAQPEELTNEAPADCGQQPDAQAAEENSTPTAVPDAPPASEPSAPVPPPPPPVPVADETPCEIAADELPQAGE